MVHCTGPLPQCSLCFFLLFCVFCSLSCKAADTLSPDQSIRDGQTLTSAGEDFQLGFFSPFNSKKRFLGIWFTSTERVVWVANRDKPVQDSAGVLTLRKDGNLVVSDGHRNIVWSTDAKTMLNNSIAVLMYTGNLILREGNNTQTGRIAWQSFDHPAEVLLPGMKIGINLKTGENRMLRSWKSDSDPSPGIFSFGIDPQEPNQFFIWRRTVIYWRTIFWNGSTYNVIPESGQNLVRFSIKKEKHEVYFMLSFPLEAIVMDHSGVLTYISMVDGTSEIRASWYGRGQYCSPESRCGPFSICNENNRPPCKCLPGFQPIAKKDWDSGDWSGGCVRITSLQCGEEDGFLLLKMVKLSNPTDSTAEVENERIAERCA